MESFSGRVVPGKRLGHALGFPTANLETDAAPARGVYAVIATTAGGRYRAMMNVGSHPTAPEGPPTIEVYLLDFEGDLYGCEMRVDIVRFLRGERKFESLEALRLQLERDQAQTRAVVAL